MKKEIIEVDIPDSINLDHMWQSLYDALWNSDNVTSDEYSLVLSMVDKLRTESKSSRKMGVLWSMDEVFMRAEDIGMELTEDEANEVLKNVIQSHDENIGINWDVIDFHIKKFKA